MTGGPTMQRAHARPVGRRARRRRVDARTDGERGLEVRRAASNACVIDGDAFVVKHVDRAYDWIARQTGDLACWPIVVWERGLVDLAPECIDHTIVGAARTATGGALLMRDVSAWLVPADDTPLSARATPALPRPPRGVPRRVLGLGGHDRAVAARQPLRPVRPGGARLRGRARPPRTGDRASPRQRGCGSARSRRAWRPRSRRCGARRGRWSTRSPAYAAHVPPRRLEARQPRQPPRRPHRARRLVDARLRAAGRRARALPRAECRRGCPWATRRTMRSRRTARRWSATASTPSRGSTGSSRCACSAVMLQLGWEKSFDEQGDELAWWAARVEAGVRELRLIRAVESAAMNGSRTAGSQCCLHEGPPSRRAGRDPPGSRRRRRTRAGCRRRRPIRERERHVDLRGATVDGDDGEGVHVDQTVARAPRASPAGPSAPRRGPG